MASVPDGGVGLSLAELEATVAGLLEDAESEVGADQARRDLLMIAASLLRDGDPVPNALGQWLAGRLLDLHKAIDSGKQSDVVCALVGLGRRSRGRQVKGGVSSADSTDDAGRLSWRELEISAAAAVLAALAGPVGVAGIKESIAVAVGQSYDTVDRACNENPIDLGGDTPDEDGCEELRSLAEGLAAPVISAIRLSIRRDPQLHHPQMRDLLRSYPRL